MNVHRRRVPALYYLCSINYTILKIAGIIPARYDSSRFPGKPLALIAGKPMIQRVYEQCLLADGLSDVIIATDDPRIQEAVSAFGGKSILTGEHPNGTSRCAEAALHLPVTFDAIINIQGDEPMIHPQQINELVERFYSGDVQIATLIRKEHNLSRVNNENIVKAFYRNNGETIDFKRLPDETELSAISAQGYFYQHVGLYGFKRTVLNEIVHLPPTPREQTEKLEQLRWLEHGYSIRAQVTKYDTHSVDTPEDLIRISAYF